MILIFMVGGAKAEISFCIRSAIPGNMVVPPDKTVFVQVLTDVDITFHDGVVSGLVDTCRFHTNEGRLEKGFWASESLIANGDNLTIR